MFKYFKAAEILLTESHFLSFASITLENFVALNDFEYEAGLASGETFNLNLNGWLIRSKTNNPIRSHRGAYRNFNGYVVVETGELIVKDCSKFILGIRNKTPSNQLDLLSDFLYEIEKIKKCISFLGYLKPIEKGLYQSFDSAADECQKMEYLLTEKKKVAEANREVIWNGGVGLLGSLFKQLNNIKLMDDTWLIGERLDTKGKRRMKKGNEDDIVKLLLKNFVKPDEDSTQGADNYIPFEKESLIRYIKDDSKEAKKLQIKIDLVGLRIAEE